MKIAKVSVRKTNEEIRKSSFESRDLSSGTNSINSSVIIPGKSETTAKKSIFKKLNGKK